MFNPQFNIFVVEQFSKAIVKLRNPNLQHIKDLNEVESIRLVESEIANLFETVVNDYKFSGDWPEVISTLVSKGDNNTFEYFCYYMLDDDPQGAQSVGLTADTINSYI